MEAVRPLREMKGHLNDNEGYNGNTPTQPGWYHTVYAIYKTLSNMLFFF